MGPATNLSLSLFDNVTLLSTTKITLVTNIISDKLQTILRLHYHFHNEKVSQSTFDNWNNCTSNTYSKQLLTNSHFNRQFLNEPRLDNFPLDYCF